MDTAAYLARLALAGPAVPSRAGLTALHRAHLFTVPFENLDIPLGRRITLEAAGLFGKIVRQRRGGFCYELNGLFASLLRALGYDVTLLAARVYSGLQPGPEFDHLCLLVHLTEPGAAPVRLLADVGFGDNFLEPLELDNPAAQVSHGAAYRLEQTDGLWRLSAQAPGAEWAPAYDFTLTPRALPDFDAMCVYQQTSPESSFTRRQVCSRATPAGRITYSADSARRRLITTANGQRTEVDVAGPAAAAEVLREHFGVSLPAELP